ncbi:MAG TPA: hypothetical protein VH107_04165 [Lacipirellulaceae bacterium]|nr:hypothetical protein [Lacipirellulaceae bacterium]
MMLSVSMPEATPQIPLYAPLQGEFGYFAAPATIVGPSQEGGPILLQADDLHGTSVAGIVDAYRSNTFDVGGNSDALPGINLTNHYDGTVTNLGQGVYDYDSSGTWTSYFDNTNGLPALRMVLNYGSAGIDMTIVGAASHSQVSAPSSSEGGSIPINDVLVELKQSPLAAPPENPAESHAVETAIDVHHAAHGTTATNLISGEWGRASVFEMVGGGRSGDERVALNTERAKIQGDQARTDHVLPLSLDGEEAPAPQAAGPRTKTDQSRPDDRADGSDGSQETRPANEAAATNGTAVVGTESAVINNHSGKVSSAGAKTSESTSGPTAMAEPHDARVFAAAAAMDEIGNVEPAFDLWRHSRVAAGVVLILALERVAAFHSREANRKPEAAEAKAAARAQRKRRQLGGLLLDPR